MTAVVIILPAVALPETRQRRRHRDSDAPCPRCGDLQFVPFARMNEAQQLWAAAEAVLPCPDCAGGAQVIPFGRNP